MTQGVSVVGSPIGGLTFAQAANKLTASIPAPSYVRLVATSDSSPMNLPASSIGLKYDATRALYEAQAIGRTGSILQRFIQRRQVGTNGRDIQLHVSFNKGALAWVLKHTASERFEVEPKDARIVPQEGQLLKIPGNSGVKIEIDKTLREPTSFAVKRPTEIITLPVVTNLAQPHITLADLQPIDSILTTYTTSYNPGKRERSSNLRLAAKSIDGALVKPGDVFSYNKTVGPRLKETGYKDAIIFVNGKMEKGTGGGICQVSSTLYNAVLLTGTQVVERSHHSMRVVYVPPGLDATVSYGSLDFRFKNTLGNAIYIRTIAGGARLTATVYGAATDKRLVKIVRKVGRSVPFKVETVVNPRLRPGRRIVQERGLSGTSAVVQRLVEQNGEMKVDMVTSSRYNPHPQIVEIGPTAPAKPKAAAPAGSAPGAPALNVLTTM